MAYAIATSGVVGGIRARSRATSAVQSAHSATRLAPPTSRPSFSSMSRTPWMSHPRRSILARAEETPSKQVVPEQPVAPGTPPNKEGAAGETAAAEPVAKEDMTPDEFGKKLQELKAAQAEAVPEKPGIVQGVREEIGQIEWPGAGTVASTTVVVCLAIMGSSLVLLTINSTFNSISEAVLANAPYNF